jgi:hypothetical protein
MERERMKNDEKLLPKTFIESNIIDYIENGYNLKYVKSLLQNGTLRVDGKFSNGFRLDGKSYLGFSIACNQTDLALTILQKGGNPHRLEIEYPKNNNTLIPEYFYQDFSIEKNLFFFNQRRAESSFRLFSPMILSVEKDNPIILNNLIERGTNPDIGMFYGKSDSQNFDMSDNISPLSLAIVYNNKNMVADLLENGANPWNGFINAKNVSNTIHINYILPQDIANNLNNTEIANLIQKGIRTYSMNFDEITQYNFFMQLLNEGKLNIMREWQKKSNSPKISF